MDLHKRTIAKTITWRIIAVIITIIGVYFFGKSWSIAISAGIVINSIKTIFYYLHERVWATTHWQYKKQDTRLRTLVKTISWKIITFIVTTIIVYFYTFNWSISLLSGFSINLFKAVFYYCHERIWNKLSYGRKSQQ